MWSRVDIAVQQATAVLRDRLAHEPVQRRRDMLALGIADSTQCAMVRRGLLVRLRHGIYTLSEALESADSLTRHHIDLAAAIAGADEQVWAFGSSGAIVHGLPTPFVVPDQLYLVRSSGKDERALRRPSRHRLVIPNAHVTTGSIDQATCSRVQGVQVVSPALAAVSTAAGMTSSRWRTALMDAALWRGAEVAELTELIDAWRHLGGRSELARALLRARSGAQTVLETFSRLAFMERGLPEPELQHAFHDRDGLIGYADMWWSALGVIGEADGAVKYHTRDDLLREKTREDRLRALGFAVVRWTFDEIEDAPDHVVDRVWEAARRTRRRSG